MESDVTEQVFRDHGGHNLNFLIGKPSGRLHCFCRDCGFLHLGFVRGKFRRVVLHEQGARTQIFDENQKPFGRIA